MKHLIRTTLTAMAFLCPFLAHAHITEVGLDSVQRDTASHVLETVVVRGSSVIRKGDRDIYIVTRDMRKGCYNTAQLLGKIEGMDCERMTNALRYFGSTKIKILVDSLEKDEDYVRNLGHLRFQKVEVIPHPAGKYSGYDVLVNLHTKENYVGYEGHLQVQSQLYVGDSNGDGKNLGSSSAEGSYTWTYNKWNASLSTNGNWRQSSNEYLYDKKFLGNDLREQCVPNEDGEANRVGFVRGDGTTASLDYQIDKDNSVSLTYYLGITANDTYSRSTLLVSDLQQSYTDTVRHLNVYRDNGYRHTVGLYYRGRSKLWSYSASFNYTNNGWRTRSLTDRSSGYHLEDNRRNMQNYTWSNVDVTRRNKRGNASVTFGYTNYWKDYRIDRLSSKDFLSSTTNLRNEVYASASYRLGMGLTMSANGSLQHIHNSSSTDVSEDYLVYSFGAHLYKRLAGVNYVELNYTGRYSQPTINQVSDYGQFTDTLEWVGGNPNLRAYTTHHVSVVGSLWNILRLCVGTQLRPGEIAFVSDLAAGNGSTYVRSTWQNTDRHNFYAWAMLWKRVGAFKLSLLAQYDCQRASYGGIHYSNQGASGNADISYSSESWYAQARYALNNSYGASVQGTSDGRTDQLSLVVNKALFHQGLVIAAWGYLPLHLTSGRMESSTHSPILESVSTSNNQWRRDWSFGISLRWNFQGGKSVRQYKRELQFEQ